MLMCQVSPGTGCLCLQGPCWGLHCHACHAAGHPVPQHARRCPCRAEGGVSSDKTLSPRSTWFWHSGPMPAGDAGWKRGHAGDSTWWHNPGVPCLVAALWAGVEKEAKLSSAERMVLAPSNTNPVGFVLCCVL